MRIYVAGALADLERVREVQDAVVAAGHEVVLDWTRASDADLRDYGSQAVAAEQVARADLEAVLGADAVLVVDTDQPGRGMYVELGAALARAARGESVQIAVLGPEADRSVFYFHPAVRRYDSVEEWLASS
ncbi:nucleoside 2-deoxyribosyltransferase [Nocardioides sp. GXZ039]|uniref:nucleoside 2-deoxyribosyltransferase n=1 Tax=Nocardioides sp. GXZ039 TaxID=3136018 RepID=UPI0030F3B4C2